jgi:hypothetical protein
MSITNLCINSGTRKIPTVLKNANEVHSCVYDFQVLVLDWWCVALSRVYK